jgi:hypothetical protein
MSRTRHFEEDQVPAGAVAVFRERGYKWRSMPDLTALIGPLEGAEDRIR